MILMRNGTPICVLTTAIVWMVLTAGATAQFIVASHSRSVSATAQLGCLWEGPGELPVDASGMSTADMGVFNQSVTATMSPQTILGLACTRPNEEISSSATQNTTIAGAIVQGSGTAIAGKGGGSVESGSATGSSMLSVNLQVPAAMSYQLFGSVDGLESGPGVFLPGQAMVTLKQGQTIIHSVSPNEPDISGGGTEHLFSFAGVLLPGDYTLDAIAFAGASGPIEQGVRSDFSLTFVPEPTVMPWTFAIVVLLAFQLRRAWPATVHRTNA